MIKIADGFHGFSFGHLPSWPGARQPLAKRDLLTASAYGRHAAPYATKAAALRAAANTSLRKDNAAFRRAERDDMRASRATLRRSHARRSSGRAAARTRDAATRAATGHSRRQPGHTSKQPHSRRLLGRHTAYFAATPHFASPKRYELSPPYIILRCHARHYSCLFRHMPLLATAFCPAHASSRQGMRTRRY